MSGSIEHVESTAGPARVEAALAGDKVALEELIREHLPLVYSIVGRALSGHPDVDDVVQETMLRVVRQLPDLRDPSRFRAWLVAIAMRQVQDHRRAESAIRARRSPVEEAAGIADGGDFVDDTTARLSGSTQRDDLLAASRWLSGDERAALALWWQEVDGRLTRAEVAAGLSLSPPHAAVRIQRMRMKLVLALTVLRAWRVRPRCAGLAAAASGWTGGPDARVLKRLSRHVRDCPACSAAGTSSGPIEQQLVGVGLLPLPALLLERILAGVGAAAAKPLLSAVSAKLLTAVVAVAAAAGVVTTVLVTMPPGGRPEAAPAPSAVVSTPGGAPPATAAPTVTASAGSAAPARPAAIHVAPAGDDAGDGSAARPYATLTRAASVARPGQTIYLRGGTYQPTKPVDITTSGTADQPITLTNYPGERAVFDASLAPAGRPFIAQHADHWVVSGLEVVKARHLPYVCESCRYNTFQALAMHDNSGTGFVLRGDDTIGNQILDSDFYDNHDAAGRDADGLAIIQGSGAGNLVRNCRMFHNVDDGLEVGEFASPVTIDASWAFGNGVNRWKLPAFSGSGNGFSLGAASTAPAVAHVITRSAAWRNGGYGFTESGNTGAIRVTNNTAFRNVKDGFAFYYSPSQFRGNLALGNDRQAVLAAGAAATGNSWDQPGWSDTVLRSIDPTSAEGPRRPDGRQPATTYLTNTKDPAVGAPMTAAA